MHGLGVNAGTWSTGADLESLAARYHLYLVDTVGDRGRSIINQKPRSGELYVDWLQEVFTELGLERAMMAGTSFGAAISLLMAHRAPQRVSGVAALVPMSVVCKLRTVPMLRMVAMGMLLNEKRLIRYLRYANGGAEIDLELAAETIDLMLNYPGAREGFIAAPIPVLSDVELQAVEVPCSCYLGEGDPFYRASKVKARLDSLECQVQAKVVSGMGHFLGQDFAPYIIEGLGDASAGARSQPEDQAVV